MEELRQWDRCRGNPSTHLPETMRTLNISLDWREWDRCLVDHPHQVFRKYVVDGIRHGFRVGFDYVGEGPTRSSWENMISTQEHPDIIQDYLAEERSEGIVPTKYCLLY
jgi:hypothetical protein